MVVNYVNMQGVPLYVPAVIGDLALQSADNVNITGGSITGITDLAIADGGTGASTAANARANLGATTIGSNLFTLTNPAAIAFPRFNADNTVSSLSAADFRTAISAQAASGNLTGLAGLTPNDGNFIVGNGFGWTVESGATARNSLGLNWTKVADLTPINGFTALPSDWPNELWSHPSGLKLVRFGLVNTTANPSNTIALSWSGNIATQLWNTPASTDGNGARVYIAGSNLVYDKGASAPSTVTFCVGSLFFL